MKATKSFIVWIARGLTPLVCVASALPAVAQRVQFPTMIEQPSAITAWQPVAQSPPAWASGPSTFSSPPSAAPLTGTPAFDPYAPATTAPSFTSPPAYSPYASSPFVAPAPAPYAAPAPYSPYAPSPYSPTPGALYPEGVQMPQLMPGNFNIQQGLRFMQEARLRWTWLSPMGSDPLGVNDVETSATFAFPFLRSISSPLLVTPGFGIHFWEGPVTEAPDFADLPARTYDAYLDTAWYPQITPWLAAQLGVRVGAYTDFNTFTTHSIRIMGRGLAVVTFTPTLQFALGVVYLDRLVVKILPAGGLIWTPNPDARYEILFPNPKLARRWTTIGNTDLWFYVTGEYGGGSWTIERIAGNDQFDYNDIRVALGLETFGMRGFHGLFEVGYVFDREVVYRSATPTFDASETLMLRAGVSF